MRPVFRVGPGERQPNPQMPNARKELELLEGRFIFVRTRSFAKRMI
jgi:hypothetical protein